MKKIIMLGVSTLMFTFFGVAQSFACSCMMPEDALSSMKMSDGVFVGTVTQIETKDTWNNVSIDVSESFKGVDLGTMQLTTGSSSAACGINFKKDAEYLVYAYKEDDGAYSANLCSRTTLLENAQEDIKALGKDVKEFASQTIFEMAQGHICEAASDGCNNLIMSEGKVIGNTRMYCADHTPAYTCTSWKQEEEIKEPIMCTMEYAPVCGIDGKTYGNDCAAGDVEIAYLGECGAKKGLSDNDYDQLLAYNGKLNITLSNLLEKALTKYSEKVAEKKVSEQIITHQKVTKRAENANTTLLAKYPADAELPETAQQIHMAITVLKLKVMQMLNGLK